MRPTEKIGALLLAAGVVGGTAAWIAPAGAQEATTAASTAEGKVAAGQTLTATDKATLAAQVKSVPGYSIGDPTTTADDDTVLNAAFNAYGNGDASLLEALPGDTQTTVANDAASAKDAAGAATTASVPVYRSGFTVNTSLRGLIFHETIATWHQHVQADYTPTCLWPPSFHQDWSYNITQNGSLAGWSFDRVTKLTNAGVKYGTCGENGQHTWFAQGQFVQGGHFIGSWNPWIQQNIIATAGCPDSAWATSGANSLHALCTGIQIA